jgi:hypothetical protein
LNFYHKFISRFSEVAAPLTNLTKETVDTTAGLLTAEFRVAFNLLKDWLKTAPLLCHYDFAKPRILYVDSLKNVLSAVLLQQDARGDIRPVLFLSKKWGEKETAWQVHNQELGAAVQAFIKWRAWLINMQQLVEMMSDHSNLKYLMKSKNLSDQQTRWAAFLSSFDLVIKHIPGNLSPADPATQQPVFIPAGEAPTSESVLLKDTPDGLTLQGSLLDDPDNSLEIGAVSIPLVVSQTQMVTETGVLFCPPTKELSVRNTYCSFTVADERGLEQDT